MFSSPVTTSIDELVDLRQSAQALVRRHRLRSGSVRSGAGLSRRLGRGLDFAEVREYQAGDDIRQIDWNVTARTGRAHTKLFVEERERPVLLVVDSRNGMRFGTRGMFKSVLAARLAAILGWSAVSARDRVGGYVFTDDWHAEIRPQSGRRGLMGLFRAVANAQQQTPLPGGSALADCLARLRQSAPTGSTVAILSDFRDFDTAARSSLGNALHSLDVLAIQISDPLERALPPAGRYSLTDTLGSRRLLVDSRPAQARVSHAQRFNEHQESIARFFAGTRHHRVSVSTDDDLIDAAHRALNARVPHTEATAHG